MDGIELGKQEKADMLVKIRRYMLEEFDLDVGVLQTEMFIEFFAKEAAPFYYNQGLKDAHAAILRRLDDAAADIDVLEKPLPRRHVPSQK